MAHQRKLNNKLFYDIEWHTSEKTRHFRENISGVPNGVLTFQFEICTGHK